MLVVKNPSANTGDIRDVGLIPGLGRPPGGGNGNPLQYSCLENPMDRGAWWATVLRVAQSQTRLRRHGMHKGTLALPCIENHPPIFTSSLYYALLEHRDYIAFLSAPPETAL